MPNWIANTNMTAPKTTTVTKNDTEETASHGNAASSMEKRPDDTTTGLNTCARVSDSIASCFMPYQ